MAGQNPGMPRIGIVGGGVIGWSCAHHLLELEPRADVTVFERLPSAGQGSTGRAAGGVRAQFSTPINIALSQYSIQKFETMPEIGFRQLGYLFVTASEARAESLRSIADLQKQHGVEVELLDRTEISAFAPYLFSDDLLAGAFAKKDGFLDPFAVCTWFEKSARSGGARARNGVEVVAIDAHTIQTADDSSGWDCVIVAAGHQTSALLDLPIKPEVHQLALTEPIAGLPNDLPMVVDLDTSFHFRREGNGLLIGFDDHSLAHPQNESSHPPAFDPKFLERLAEPSLHRLPLLSEARFDARKCWAGFYAQTPDHHAVIGSLNGVVTASGFGGHGIMHSPAAGRASAEIVLRGRCETFDLHPLRPTRFQEDDLIVERMVI